MLPWPLCLLPGRALGPKSTGRLLVTGTPQESSWFALGPRLAARVTCSGPGPASVDGPTHPAASHPARLGEGLPPSFGHPHRLPAAWHLQGALARPHTAQGHVLVFQLTSEQEAGSTWREAGYCLPGRAVCRSCGRAGGVGLLQNKISKRGFRGSGPPVPGGGRRFPPPGLSSQGSSVARGRQGGGGKGFQGLEPPKGPQRLSWPPGDGPQTGLELGLPWGLRAQASKTRSPQASLGRPP